MSLLFNWLDTTNFPSLGVNGPQSGQASAWRNQHRAIIKNGLIYVFAVPSTLPFSVYSSPAGASWALIDSTCPQGIFPQSVYSYVILSKPGTTLELLSSGGSASILNYSDFSGTWDGHFHIQDSVSGTFAVQNTPFGSSGGIGTTTPEAALLLFTRPDGSQIMVKQGDYDGGAISGYSRIEVWRLDLSSNWNLISTLGTSTTFHFTLMSGGIRGDGTVDFFFTRYDPSSSADLLHVTVSTSDAVSSFNTVETAVEAATFPPTLNFNRCDYSADGKTLLWAYGYNADSGNVPNGGTPTGEVHAYLGDLTGSPLTPSFTVEVVKTNTANWDQGFTAPVGASFAGGNTANVYWLSEEDPAAMGTSTGGNTGNLFHSQRTGPGAWSAPDALFNTSDYPGVFTTPAVRAFDLLNAFPNGTGVLMEVFDFSNSADYLGYNGPSQVGRFTFAYTGGSKRSRSVKAA